MTAMELRSVLLIESNDKVRARLQKSFEETDYIIFTATGIADARKILASNKVDLIVTEHFLKDGEGIAFCKELKNHPDFVGIPFVFLTAANDMIIENKALRAGARDYFVKQSVTRQQLMLRIEELILLRRERKGVIVKDHLSGYLSQFSLKELLRFLHENKKSGQVKIEIAEENIADLYLEDGELISTLYNDYDGIDAIFKIAKEEEGVFHYNNISLESVNKNMDQSTETIISLLDH
jgi:CheY-like chemotaxis protein